MVWSFPSVQKQVKETKPMQLYSLFIKTGKGQYERAVTTSFTHELAMRVWAKQVHDSKGLYHIRPIKIECDRAEGITHFGRVHYRRPMRKQFGVSCQ